MSEMNAIFEKVDTKKDIDYFKYKVLNEDYEVEKEYLELKLQPK